MRRAKGLPVWVVAVAAAGGVVGVGAVALVVAVVAHKQAALLTRDEFKAKVMERSEDEVVAAVGRPDRTWTVGTVTVWEYRRRTYDPVTGATDNDAAVDIQHGRVYKVSFSGP